MPLLARAIESRATMKDPPAWLIRAFGGGVDTSSGIVVDETSALSSTAMWAGLRTISEAAGSVPLKLYRQLARGREVAVDHAVNRTLSDPNPQQTSMEFREML